MVRVMDQHPAEELKQEVVRWHRHIVSFPKWEELLEVEYVRLHEDINMFTDDVVGRCQAMGLHRAADWLERLRSIGVHATQVFRKAQAHYERIHGPSDTWPIDSVKPQSNV